MKNEYYNTQEPIFHCVEDSLPENHPLVLAANISGEEHTLCDLCGTALHCHINNELNCSWVEFCKKNICLEHLLEYIAFCDTVVEQNDFVAWFDSKKATK